MPRPEGPNGYCLAGTGAQELAKIERPISGATRTYLLSKVRKGKKGGHVGALGPVKQRCHKTIVATKCPPINIFKLSTLDSRQTDSKLPKVTENLAEDIVPAPAVHIPHFRTATQPYQFSLPSRGELPLTGSVPAKNRNKALNFLGRLHIDPRLEVLP